jgi:predicted AlkP superfamily pyrophosphatase or phosphodiesterase
MRLPDYRGGSILNLMRCVADASGATTPYAPLAGFDVEPLRAARNIVLFVADGLGWRFLRSSSAGAALRSHAWGSMTSVFPSTTASAITTFMTGLAPRRHALTGWHMYFAELERILAVLPLATRDPALPPLVPETLPARLFDHAPLSSMMARAAFVFSPAEIAASPFNRFHAVGARTLSYQTLDDLAETVAELAGQPGEVRYIYAYYGGLDHVAHKEGIASPQAAAELEAVDRAFTQLAERLRGSDAVLLLTADHGFIDAPQQRLIELELHPELASMLALPLCGERRVAYCYVRTERRGEFEDYVARELAEAAELYRSEDLVEQGWFGPGQTHPRLASRIGDYALVMRDDWTIKDWLPGERRHRQLGVHGGISEDEMEVPLILARIP